MNIWRQLNLANQYFLSDWRILYWQILLSFTCIEQQKMNLAVFNLADFHNSPNRQNKFYTKFSSYTVLYPCHNYMHNIIIGHSLISLLLVAIFLGHVTFFYFLMFLFTIIITESEVHPSTSLRCTQASIPIL